MNIDANVIFSRDTKELLLLIGAIVGSVVIILGMLLLFFKVARVEKVSISGIECDPEDERKPAKPKTARRITRRKLK